MFEAFAVLGLLFAGLFVGGQDSTSEKMDERDKDTGLDWESDKEETQNRIEFSGNSNIAFARASVTDFFAHANNSETIEEDLLLVQGSNESDQIRVTGTGFEVVGGDGSDLFDIKGAGKVLVWADAGDTVLGSNLEGDHNVNVVISGSGTFLGGNSDELGIAVGSGGSLYGGEGDDTLESFEGASLLIGGGGQDFIISDQTMTNFRGSADMVGDDRVDYHSDSVFGGDGNDTISLSRLDIASGGSGSDSFVVYEDFSEGDAARITDFDKIDDKVLIQLGGYSSVLDESSCMDILEQISVKEIDGSTIIMNNGKVVTFLEGVTGVSVGIALPETEIGQKFLSLDGTVQPPTSFNVLIVNYSTIAS